MNKVQVKVGNSIIEADGANAKEVFDGISALAEAFSEPCCGQCKSTNIAPKQRTVAGDKFYEWVCMQPDCGAKLAMGVGKVAAGTLYPKRLMMPEGRPEGKNEEGTYDSVNLGWHFYPPRPLKKPASGTSVRR